MGGGWFPSDGNPGMPGPGTDCVGPEERLAHVAALRPEICSIDCGTMNFGDHEIYISTPQMLRKMATIYRLNLLIFFWRGVFSGFISWMAVAI